MATEPLSRNINVLCTTFSGLGLPKTLSIPLASDTSIGSLIEHVVDRLPSRNLPLVITTNSNKALAEDWETPISSLTYSRHDYILPLRLSVPLCGGKGGFGSQLRAAGGRMSSKKKKNQGDNNGSNRNLDGRRLRTITEAKALAEYLATKPEMERKEKEARQKRWQQVVDLAEKREEEIRAGNNQRVDGRWVEEKSEAVDAIRDAVLKAMEDGSYHNNLAESSTEAQIHEQRKPEKTERQRELEEDPSISRARAPDFFGFDNEDDWSSDEDEGSSEVGEQVSETVMT